jgi:CRP-like cAMP-binding protein
MNGLIQYLKEIDSFPQDELDMARDLFQLEKISKGDYYLKAGQDCDKISFVSSGLFRLFYQLEGEERIMLFFSENQFMTDYFGYLTCTPSIRPIQALEDSVVYSIQREQLDQLFAASKSWEHLGRILAEAAYVKSVHLANRLLHDDPDTRLNTFMEENPGLLQRVPQYMIASHLQMTPETLSRVKKRLRDQQEIKDSIHKKI